MHKRRVARIDDRAVSPVVATILLVAITVVLAATIYVMISAFIGPTESGPQFIGFIAERTGTNWTVTIVSTPTGLHPDSTFFLLRDVDLRLVMNRTSLSALTIANWATYHVHYQSATPGSQELRPSDRIYIDANRYPTANVVEISDASRILGSQRLG